MRLKQKIAQQLTKVLGWKFVGSLDPNYTKYVILMAPHTSIWDFIWGKLAFSHQNIKGHYLVKKELFFFPLGSILKYAGAIPVDRGKRNNIVETMTKKFEIDNKFCLTITPEGTRKKVTKWKKGFIQIATMANVPIVLGYVDYKKKEFGLFNIYHPTGDMDADIAAIRKFYLTVNAKYPENFYID